MALERIVARARADVAARMAALPLAALQAQCRPSDRDFAAALRRVPTGFIMECKRASPSEGVLRDAYDPVAIAMAYAPFADAISVLCDGPFFGGSLDHLRAVRAAVDVPVLCKDFVVDPWQVWEARVAGADAILLMLSVLDDAQYRACAAAAGEAGIATLTEVHTEAELHRALALGAPVIGINNRDLSTLRVHLETTHRLAPLATRAPVLVSESGIRDHGDVRALAPLVDGFLVGSSLVKSGDLPQAVRALVFGLTKVCGLTRPLDAAAAWAAGATHGGLIFAAGSPRQLTVDVAEQVMRGAPLAWVGVFVDQGLERVASIAQRLGLAAVQLHGSESPEEIAALRARLPEGTEIWKAFRVRDRLPTLDAAPLDRIVLDTWHPTAHGGTGTVFDWQLLGGHPMRERIILAGGLTPERVAAAAQLGVGGLDVSSGVEAAPGIKDHARLAAFFAARRGTGREHGRT